MLRLRRKAKYDDFNTVDDYGKNDLTQTVDGVLPVEVVMDIEPSGHPRRTWNMNGDTMYFGHYEKSKWYEFLKDIRANGVQDAIMIYVEKDGQILLGEGSHRIEACLQTGTKEIPVDIRYFGGSETFVDYFDEYIKE